MYRSAGADGIQHTEQHEVLLRLTLLLPPAFAAMCGLTGSANWEIHFDLMPVTKREMCLLAVALVSTLHNQ